MLYFAQFDELASIFVKKKYYHFFQESYLFIVELKYDP